MKEQTILRCGRCLSHTPLIETDTAESIMEAIAKHKHCGVCGSRAMLCFSSKIVPVGKGKVLSWKSANAPAINRSKHKRANRPAQARHDASASRVQAVRVKKAHDVKRMDGACR